ncbi:pyridoxal-phosphate-dependent aminotransferase family protein [Chachezhania antarctica]|uniref:pyridoxal-phosphate-dependent aminotransferase family protein n=1 Tax=Chachezhania antarctica TaxID=2340860 RepID=UPI000EB29EBB|nr:aminotransferase class V-fold PLP-dependent enzyme [Chachezhania antarctica]|tara:strand:+ start:8529 stop:9752 length:1224 start_codon:yes stop_codon:yes gene_type:complete
MPDKPTLSMGREFLAIPGPSVMPDAVLRAMHRAAPNIYEGDLVEMTHGIVADLRKVARTKHNATIYVCNGHGGWEAALTNVLGPGDKALSVSVGYFGQGWANTAQAQGVEVQRLNFFDRGCVDLDVVADALKADTNHEIKVLLGTHVDTATSIRTDPRVLREVLDATGHPALLAMDCIASMACDRFEMDDWGVDIAVTGSQKGLMVPPGLAFVFFSDKAAEVRKGRDLVQQYWDWVPRANPQAFPQHFGGTAPTHHLHGLRAALDLLMGEGMENVWARHAALARAIWAACDAWGTDGPLEMNVPDPANRSHAVTGLRLEGDQGTRLRQWVEENVGLTLGIGLGFALRGQPEWDRHFRIGHMGYLNGQMVMGALGGIEAGLTALDIAHGDGALSAAARVIAAGPVFDA